ncbi:MAG: hypothetical protein JWQ59_1180 [Cryobacterium sp.]|jgi:hypothetical protein|nr:hypothetical protein [Cryobacterium sp.]
MWASRRKHRQRGNAESGSSDADNTGFTGLEGDFEAERRRAASATHEKIAPYAHDDGPTFPDDKLPLTHP